jgi:hypothetical protein
MWIWALAEPIFFKKKAIYVTTANKGSYAQKGHFLTNLSKFPYFFLDTWLVFRVLLRYVKTGYSIIQV